MNELPINSSNEGTGLIIMYVFTTILYLLYPLLCCLFVMLFTVLSLYLQHYALRFPVCVSTMLFTLFCLSTMLSTGLCSIFCNNILDSPSTAYWTLCSLLLTEIFWNTWRLYEKQRNRKVILIRMFCKMFSKTWYYIIVVCVYCWINHGMLATTIGLYLVYLHGQTSGVSHRCSTFLGYELWLIMAMKVVSDEAEFPSFASLSTFHKNRPVHKASRMYSQISVIRRQQCCSQSTCGLYPTLAGCYQSRCGTDLKCIGSLPAEVCNSRQKRASLDEHITW